MCRKKFNITRKISNHENSLGNRLRLEYRIIGGTEKHNVDGFAVIHIIDRFAENINKTEHDIISYRGM